jgi:peptidoglycan hydrolase-like protein with peptidoglycan-binding domain
MYKILTKGKKSFDVISMQQLLNKVNKENRIIVDGNFGNKTQESLKQFQEKVGIETTGVLGLMTIKKLYEESQVNVLGLKSFVYAGMSEDQYFPEYQRKDIIVMHHTAGSGNPYYVRDHWQKNKNKVGTFLIIGGKGQYDGVNMQVFTHPDQWAYHLKDGKKNYRSRSLQLWVS